MALSEPRLQARAAAPSAGLPRVDTLAPGDVAGALALSDAAGWNQVADDWTVFIEQGRTFGGRDGQGRLVATAAALPYGRTAGWISMVLVAEAWQHRGLASALVRECVAHLQSIGALPMLDATPAGAEVYRRLGFAEGFAFDRWQSDASVHRLDRLDADAVFAEGLGAHCVVDDASTSDVQSAGPADLDRIEALDATASGLDRRFLFAHVLARAATRAWLHADGNGFVIARGGRRATQIGPLIADNGRHAVSLLRTALAASSGPVYVDVPAAQQEIAGWLERRGFRRQRAFVRMSLGAAYPPEVGERCVVLAGPEFG